MFTAAAMLDTSASVHEAGGQVSIDAEIPGVFHLSTKSLSIHTCDGAKSHAATFITREDRTKEGNGKGPMGGIRARAQVDSWPLTPGFTAVMLTTQSPWECRPLAYVPGLLLSFKIWRSCRATSEGSCGRG